MATWQADFAVRLPGGQLPADYRAAIGAILPSSEPWCPELEVWGSQAGDRIDVWWSPDHTPEVLLRLDLRSWNRERYSDLVTLLTRIGATLHVATAEGPGAEVPLTLQGLESALRESDAFRFVSDPREYLEELGRRRSGGP